MNSNRGWILAALMLGFVGGAVATVDFSPSREAFAQAAPGWDDHWRYHDGRWSYWNQADRLWYYTDGTHWFYNDGRAWVPYRFDRHFGHKFERGAYRAPGEGVEVKLPNHKIYVGP